MIYRRNEKGRYEGVTARGQVIGFEDAEEMVACAELRAEINRLIGSDEKILFEGFMPKAESGKCEDITSKGKKRRIKIDKHSYVTDGGEIKKSLA
jgi:hypothetical protein